MWNWENNFRLKNKLWIKRTVVQQTIVAIYDREVKLLSLLYSEFTNI